jgi:ABC-type sugar transport system ATPase subunit
VTSEEAGLLDIRNLVASYDGQNHVLRNLTLSVRPGELLAVVGPSGCGKTTLLRVIAGFVDPIEGEILLNGRSLHGVPVRERNLAFIMENWGIYPHLNVFDNIAYPLRLRKMSVAEVSRRVHAVAEQLGLLGMLTRRPSQLSGGQRQRVAVGRALVRDDVVMLLADEAFSNLDARLRHQMRIEFKEMQRSRSLTSIFVTHSQDEAMALGDRVVVLNAGEIAQDGTARELYYQPNSTFVAGFIGQPAMNVCPAVIVNGSICLEGQTAPLAVLGPNASALEGSALLVGFRPEHIILCSAKAGPIKAEVYLIEHAEPDVLIYLRAGLHRMVARMASREDIRVGDTISALLQHDDIVLFDRESGLRLGYGNF